ncbi:NAD(+) diphosphatase [Stenotrophomonas mori]|uniref:NAD(+) diphosphatase n=1 Tax=Stenotrophomonas mori TaxID=2871096 RepID=A0ABT0SJ55_9GAMM|nr:NAD(+) diphosphatase [Stenotrophomonas mori]MCL7715368.1 NAD(+) diphosphatase [Stenotrophomonas mori]
MPDSAASFHGHAFAGAALDRADALRDDADALARLWPQARVLVLDADGTAFADGHGQPLLSDGQALGGGPGAAIFLGLQQGRAWFVAEAATVTLQAPGRVDLRRAAVDWPADAAAAFCYARGMSYWHSRTRFCGVCGERIGFERGGFIGRCGQCGTEHYPRVDPAVIVAVEHAGRLLLGRQSSWAPRRWSVLAGFVEPGETFEQTVVREVFEETRVRVIQAAYLGTQPWPFPGALMVGFRATAHGDAPQVDGELEDARWFDVDEVAAALRRDRDDDGGGILLPPRISIARTLIEDWYRRRTA